MNTPDEFSGPWPKDAHPAFQSSRDSTVHDTLEDLKAHHRALDRRAERLAAEGKSPRQISIIEQFVALPPRRRSPA